jgi:hypothetical protein
MTQTVIEQSKKPTPKKTALKANLDDSLPSELKEVVNQAETGLGSVEDSSVVGEEESVQAKQAGAEPESDKSESSEQGVQKQITGGKIMAELTKEDIRKEVEAILTDKDAQTKVEARISGLDGEKTELSRKLAEAQTANQELTSKSEAATQQALAKEEEFKALAKEKDELLMKATEAQKKLDEIRIEQTLATRKTVMAEAGILFTEAAKQTKQLDKVKAMTEETFVSYKEEMLEVKALAVATQKPVETAPAVAAVTEAAVVARAEASKKDDEGLPPPENISDGEAFRRSVASTQQSVEIDEAQVSVYAKM